MLHTAEDTVSNCMGILGPRVFGIKTTKVLPTVGDDENIQKKARYVQTILWYFLSKVLDLNFITSLTVSAHMACILLSNLSRLGKAEISPNGIHL